MSTAFIVLSEIDLTPSIISLMPGSVRATAGGMTVPPPDSILRFGVSRGHRRRSCQKTLLVVRVRIRHIWPGGAVIDGDRDG